MSSPQQNGPKQQDSSELSPDSILYKTRKAGLIVGCYLYYLILLYLWLFHFAFLILPSTIVFSTLLIIRILTIREK